MRIKPEYKYRLRYYGIDDMLIYDTIILDSEPIIIGCVGSIILIKGIAYEIVNIISWLETKQPYIRITIKTI